MVLVHNWTEEDLIYAAGFFDADGSVSLQSRPPKGTRTSHSFVLDANVSNTDVGVLKWFREKFGGGQVIASPRENAPKAKPGMKWYVTGTDAQMFLGLVEPYLIVKSKRARTAIGAWENRLKQRGGAGNFLSAGTSAMRQSYASEMKRMNMRGVS